MNEMFSSIILIEVSLEICGSISDGNFCFQNNQVFVLPIYIPRTKNKKANTCKDLFSSIAYRSFTKYWSAIYWSAIHWSTICWSMISRSIKILKKKFHLTIFLTKH